VFLEFEQVTINGLIWHPNVHWNIEGLIQYNIWTMFNVRVREDKSQLLLFGKRKIALYLYRVQWIFPK